MPGNQPRRTILVLVASLIALGACTASDAPVPKLERSTTDPNCTRGVGGDVNGDGYGDVAVGAPGADGSRGAVHVFSGHQGRLVTSAVDTALDDVVITQSTPGVPGEGEAEDRFGDSLLSADFNGDGCAEIAIGAYGEHDGDGSITVCYGSRAGLQTGTAALFTLDAIAGANHPAGEKFLGRTMAAGDLDGDGIDDLVTDTGTSYAVDGGITPRQLYVLYGAPGGLGSGRATDRISAGTLGLSNDWGDGGLAVGDFDGDDSSEIAIGASREVTGDLQTSAENGVYVVARQDQAYAVVRSIFASTPGFPENGRGDWASTSKLAVGDVQADGADDLAMSGVAPGIDEPDDADGHGTVALLLGSKDRGLTTAGSQFWTQDSPGVSGKEAFGHAFGTSLAFGQLDADPNDDLVIGAPGDGDGGAVLVLLGGPDGLSTDGIGGGLYFQGTPGVVGTDELNDDFGRAVTLVKLSGYDRPAAMIVGVPFESVGPDSRAGAVIQFGASERGPIPGRTLNLSSLDVNAKPNASDQFGWSLS